MISADFAKIYYQLHPRFEENLFHQSVRILQYIQFAMNPTIKQIAEAFRLSHNTTSEHVKKLERLGYIEKKRNPEDQRQVTIGLTDLGDTIVRRHTELDPERLNQVLATMSKTEQQTIEQAFRLLREAADDCFSR
ncbi:MarR family winged helix-turn-helix transcriptional regulator [Exiguobacterium sp. OS-77]|uniref:MarR family winged helix-turn-helix transcriptional regulator n=1 Tax=Exiguobacterium sp. OS-77 TaxID=1241306 RepID=UPI0004004EE6|nr:MarR family transcriptional regulator [Exiguobacterium sp. OS-77]